MGGQLGELVVKQGKAEARLQELKEELAQERREQGMASLQGRRWSGTWPPWTVWGGRKEGPQIGTCPPSSPVGQV